MQDHIDYILLDDIPGSPLAFDVSDTKTDGEESEGYAE